MSNLYQEDFYQWTVEQGALLRRVAAGERLEDAQGIDLLNVAEEVEALGRAELRVVKNALQSLMSRLLLLHGWEGHEAGPLWRIEAEECLDVIRDRRRHSMATVLNDVAPALWSRANREARILQPDITDPPATLPVASPWSLSDLLFNDASVAALLEVLKPSSTG